MNRSRHVVCLVCSASASIFLVLALVGAPARAQESEFVLTVSAPARVEGEPGTMVGFEVVVGLESHVPGDLGAAGWSFGIVADGGVADRDSFTTNTEPFIGTDVLRVTDPDDRFIFAERTTGDDNEGVVSAVALGLAEPRFFPAEGEFEILRFRVQALVAPSVLDGEGVEVCDPREVRLAFVDGLQGRGQPVKNRVTYQGQSFVPEFESATVEVCAVLGVTPLPPVADAGADRAAAELTMVELDGSGSIVAAGNVPTFEWEQVAGTPVADLVDADTQRASIVVPSVSTDEDLEFRLTVSDENGEASDFVRVRAIDVDAREARLTIAADAVGSSGDPNQVVVFAGDIVWGTDLEDGVWEGVTFSARGAGDESELISSLRVFIDSDGDGVLSDADEPLGEPRSVTEDGGRVSIDFGAAARTLAEGEAERFFLVATPAGAGAESFLLPLCVGATLLRLLARRRRRRRPARGVGSLSGFGVVLAFGMFAALVPVACSSGGGGGGGGAEAASREVRFDIVAPEDLELSGADTGVRGRAANAPVTGSAVEL